MGDSINSINLLSAWGHLSHPMATNKVEMTVVAVFLIIGVVSPIDSKMCALTYSSTCGLKVSRRRTMADLRRRPAMDRVVAD